MDDGPANPVSAIILAGGRGRRVGNRDKGLIELDGKRLIEHVITRLQDQVAEFIISCNRNVDTYQRYGQAITDREKGFPGPLMGMMSAAAYAAHELCLVVPCDMPLLPADLCPRLNSMLGNHDVAVAHDGERLQPLVSLIRKPVIDSIAEYLATGNGSVKGWLKGINVVEVDFSDESDAFRNINRL